jgi:NAD+ synthase (glutamine-hydrolysing)
MLKLALAQLNYTVGDFGANASAITEAMERARGQGAQLVVFSELALCGYYPGDLLEEPAFLAGHDAALARIIDASRRYPGLVVVLGALRPNRGPGKPLHNALLAIADGMIVAEYCKQLLPTYDVFDERRHFEPGPNLVPVIEVAGCRVGFMICEDAWNDEGLEYAINPFDALRRAKPQLVVSINASPSNLGKREQRHEIFSAAARRHGLPLVYLNQVGGQDQLVFDGASFAATPEDGIVFEAENFVEDFRVLAFDEGRFLDDDGAELPPLQVQPLSAPDFARRQIVLGLKDYARRCGFTTAVVGSSGGIDSALTLALAVEALGPENVVAITMPSALSSAGSVSDSEELCRNLGIALHAHPIADLVERYQRGYADAFDGPLAGLALENLQARVRGTILMEYSNSFGSLLLTTGNKSEIAVGYCTLYGDTNGGLGLIGDLYKTEVYALAREINASAGREIIPEAVLSKPPSAELAPGQRDIDSLPPYETLDEILKWHIEGVRLAGEFEAAEQYVRALAATPEGGRLVGRILSMVARNEYKRRQAPPVIRVRARAFGTGRQMPICAKYSPPNEFARENSIERKIGELAGV